MMLLAIAVMRLGIKLFTEGLRKCYPIYFRPSSPQLNGFEYLFAILIMITSLSKWGLCEFHGIANFDRLVWVTLIICSVIRFIIIFLSHGL